MGDKRLNKSESSICSEGGRRNRKGAVVSKNIPDDQMLHLSPSSTSADRTVHENLSSSPQKEGLGDDDSNLWGSRSFLAVADLVLESKGGDHADSEDRLIDALIARQQQRTNNDAPNDRVKPERMALRRRKSASDAMQYNDKESLCPSSSQGVDGFLTPGNEEKLFAAFIARQNQKTNNKNTIDDDTNGLHKPENMRQQRRKSSSDVIQYKGTETRRRPSLQGLGGFIVGEGQRSFQGLKGLFYNTNHTSGNDPQHEKQRIDLARPEIENQEDLRPKGKQGRRSSIKAIANLVKDSISTLIGDSAEDTDIILRTESSNITDCEIQTRAASDKGQFAAISDRGKIDSRADITSASRRGKSRVDTDNNTRRPSTVQQRSVSDSSESNRSRRWSDKGIIKKQSSRRDVLKSSCRRSDSRRRLGHEGASNRMENSSLDGVRRSKHKQEAPFTKQRSLGNLENIATQDVTEDKSPQETRRQSATMRTTGAQARRRSFKTDRFRRAHSSVSLEEKRSNTSVGLSFDDEPVENEALSKRNGTKDSDPASPTKQIGKDSGGESSKNDAAGICVDAPACPALLPKETYLEPKRRRSSLSVTDFEQFFDTAEFNNCEGATGSFKVDDEGSARRRSTSSALSPMIHCLVEQAVEASQSKQAESKVRKANSRKDLFAETADEGDDSFADILRSRRLRGSFRLSHADRGLLTKSSIN